MSQSKTSRCVPKPAPLVGSVSPETADGAALTASHCPASGCTACVRLTPYCRGWVVYTRPSATRVTSRFMSCKKKLFGYPICWQNCCRICTREEQCEGSHCPRREGTEQLVEYLALCGSCHCRLGKQPALVKSNGPDRERGVRAECQKLSSSREFTAFPTYESSGKARTALWRNYPWSHIPTAVSDGNTTVCGWAAAKKAILTHFGLSQSTSHTKKVAGHYSSAASRKNLGKSFSICRLKGQKP